MKPRTVIVTLEIVTDAPLKALKRPEAWFCSSQDDVALAICAFEVQQVDLNVVKETKKIS